MRKEAQFLDNEFVNILTQVEQIYTHFSKHTQIRVQKWIIKLIASDETLHWKKNRNNYLKLLAFMISQKNIQEPFLNIPPPTDLPYLSDYQLSLKVKPNFNIISYFQTKPQILKISEPYGDDSYLRSLGGTQRSDLSTEEKTNGILAELNNFKNIKQSKLVKQSEWFSLKSSNYSKIQQNVTPVNGYSAKSSQLHFKATQKFVNCNKQVQNQNKYKYKQIALLMASILLKNEFALQKQEEYWIILKSINSFCGKQFQQMETKIKQNCQRMRQKQVQVETQQKQAKIQESVDFTIQEGVQPSKALIFQLQNCEYCGITNPINE